MKFIRPIFISLLILSMSGGHAFSQDSTTLNKTRIADSAPFPGERDWANYLKQNVDTTVPIRNKAKKGTYTVIVQFVVDNEGSVSDVKALTNNGYGMEEELVRVIRKVSPVRWEPASQEPKKTIKRYRKQTFTFVVQEKKGFAKRRN